MLKLWHFSSCVLCSSYSTFKLSALRLGIRRCQSSRRYNSSNSSSETIKSTTTTTTKPHVTRRARVISTLHPSRLQDSDFLDLSNGIKSFHLNASAPTILVPLASSSPLQQLFMTQIYYYGDSALGHTFPTHARGFLYYHRDPELPPISGAVRFRIMPDDSSAISSGFGAGTDLMLPNSRVPWAIWLVTIANVGKYVGLKQLLLSDGLVTPELLEHCKHLGARSEAHNGLNQLYHHMWYQLEQPFLLDLASETRLSVAGPQRIEQAVMTFTKVQRTGHSPRGFFPYSGSCMVRFERSLAPEHAGKHVAVIRVLEILTPIISTDPTFTPGHKGGLFRMPTVGSLLVKGDRPIMIKADGDSAVCRCLRLLM
ncbi:hypothetical protein Hypma_000021 [Hypsizygus marmoreus]|uniref:Uncharacterized protein n=1 Tax=Hypsizygus marmoreus TaxID=39966 RepID=A0A369KH72_HYPMA|nr:hypothetical protein Hypma_000021 [Hypsizygus marmoreus]